MAVQDPKATQGGKKRLTQEEKEALFEKQRQIAAAKAPKMLEILPMNIQDFSVTLAGEEIIFNRFSEKARQMIQAGAEGRVKRAGRPPKDPQAEYENSLYRIDEKRFGFPAAGFKKACVSACRNYPKSSGVTMAFIRGAFHVLGTYVEMPSKPYRFDHPVRVKGSADIRSRGKLDSWHTVLKIRYNADVITPDQICNLLNMAGFSVGVGDWRPEKNGSSGMFHVAAIGKETRKAA